MKPLQFIVLYLYAFIAHANENFVGDWESFDDKEFPISYTYLRVEKNNSVLIGIMKEGVQRVNSLSPDKVKFMEGKIIITSIDNDHMKAEYILSPLEINGKKSLLGVHYLFTRDESGSLSLGAARTLAFQGIESRSFIYDIDELLKNILK